MLYLCTEGQNDVIKVAVKVTITSEIAIIVAIETVKTP
jgi:hypothetical protein